MKVLMISGTYPPVDCGVGKYTSILAKGLEPHVDLTVLTSVNIPAQPNVLPLVGSWRFRLIPKVIKTVRSIKPDIIHLQYSTVAYRRYLTVNLLPAVLRLFFPKKPMVVTIHEYHDASFLGKLRVLITILFASLVMVSNHEDYDQLKTVLFWKKIEIINISINIKITRTPKEDHDKLLNKLGLGNCDYVVYFGQIDANKGVLQLLDSVSEWPADTKLILVGGYDPSDSLHQEIMLKLANLKNRIIWPGYLGDDEASIIIQHALFGVLPFSKPASLRRSTLLTLLFHGLPTITTGPVRLPLLDESNCLIIPDNSPESITKAVQRLFSDENLRKTLGGNAMGLSENFNWKSIIERHVDAYEKLV